MGGGEVSACVCVCVVVYKSMSVEWGRKQERLTAVFFPRDKFPTATLPGQCWYRGAKKDKIAIV